MSVTAEPTPMVFAYVRKTAEEIQADHQAAADEAISALGAVYPDNRPAIFALFCSCGAMKGSATSACPVCPLPAPQPRKPILGRRLTSLEKADFEYFLQRRKRAEAPHDMSLVDAIEDFLCR